jgi:hypothetical protein
MKKALLLLGLVLGSIGFGASALATGSGSSSSGSHRWTTTCGSASNQVIFTNDASSEGSIIIDISTGMSVLLAAGESFTRTQPGATWTITIEGESQASDGGSFAECAGSGEPDYSVSLACATAGVGPGGGVWPWVSFSNTGSVDLGVSMTGWGGPIPLTPGGGFSNYWPTTDGNDPHQGSLAIQVLDYTVTAEGDVRDTGSFALPGDDSCAGHGVQTPFPGSDPNPVPDEAPELLSECRGEDWYLVHPDDSPATTFAYRLGDPFTGEVLYDADYTSNNPDAVYGEILVPAGTDTVGYVDDFNVVHTAVRPDVCGGPEPTEPPTTTVPPINSPDGPAGSVARNLADVAHVGSYGPGPLTIGADGFTPGETVAVMLHSTPRPLGSVVADAEGDVSITFELLASDGAGAHSVVFTGARRTVTVPFTLVLPVSGGLPETL